MSLRVWLPLRGSLENQGLSQDLVVTNNGATVNNNGKIGKCYSFDGNDDYLNITNFSLSNWAQCSICCWIYPISSPSYIFLARGSSQLKVRISSDGFSFRDTQNEGNYRTIAFGTTIPVEQWSHLTCVYNSGEVSIYVNGIRTAYNTTYYHAGATLQTSVNEIRIARQQSTSSNYYYNGSINDFRVYDHALSPEEVADIAKGLVLWYPLNSRFCEATTNIVPNSDTFEGWSDYQHGYTAIVNNEFGTKSIVVTDKKSWAGIKCNITLPSTGIYTLSVYCKPIARSSSRIVQSFYFHGGGFTSDQAISADWTKINQWQRISMTKNFTDTSVTVHLIAYGGDRNNDTVSCEWTMPQVEQKDHATPYTSSVRTPTTIYDISGYKNNGTIIGNLTAAAGSPKYDVASYFNSGPYIKKTDFNYALNIWSVSCWFKKTSNVTSSFETILGLTRGDGTDTNKKFSLYIKNDTVGFVGEKTPHSSLITIDKTKWHHICITSDGSSHKHYLDGALKNTFSNTINLIDCTDFVVGGRAAIEDAVSIGTPWGGNISDVRIYATALTAEQVAELYRDSMIIDASGNVTPRGLS